MRPRRNLASEEEMLRLHRQKLQERLAALRANRAIYDERIAFWERWHVIWMRTLRRTAVVFFVQLGLLVLALEDIGGDAVAAVGASLAVAAVVVVAVLTVKQRRGERRLPEPHDVP